MNIPLTKLQKEIMSEFYNNFPIKVIFDKKERNKLWKKAASKQLCDLKSIEVKCPALAHQIIKSIELNRNIQSAVFSECVYAQSLATLFGLHIFVNCIGNTEFIPSEIRKLLKSYNLIPRYVYSNESKDRMLIQAGGCNGIDSALITVIDLNIYTIEFKEPSAKTSEPDLPKYGEDGKLILTEEFILRYPQFKDMLKEHCGLCFFDTMGKNIHDFSPESINVAVSNNYVKKYADVICTEDINGYLVMIPANQISIWADLQGEIRPAGRNHYKVWTPKALRQFLIDLGATFNGNYVEINTQKLSVRKERGGNGKISGYKINNLFFVYRKHCQLVGEKLLFNIMDVQQLNPTVAGKMFFKNLRYEDVKNFYL